MKYLMILLVSVSGLAHADYSSADFDRDQRAWEKLTDVGAPLETPEYRPEPAVQPIQTDAEFTQSVRAMDLEASPRFQSGY